MKFVRVCLQVQQVYGGDWTQQGVQQHITLLLCEKKVRSHNLHKLSNLVDKLV